MIEKKYTLNIPQLKKLSHEAKILAFTAKTSKIKIMLQVVFVFVFYFATHNTITITKRMWEEMASRPKGNYKAYVN